MKPAIWRTSSCSYYESWGKVSGNKPQIYLPRESRVTKSIHVTFRRTRVQHKRTAQTRIQSAVIKIRLHHTPAFNSIFISWPIFLNVRGINFSMRIIALVKCYRAVHMFGGGAGLRTPLIGANSISINGIKTILFKTGGLNPFGALADVKSMKSFIKSPTNAPPRSFSAGFVCSAAELIIQKLTKFQMEI